MRVTGVLIDTCFLIDFLDSSRDRHECAIRYFNYLKSKAIPFYISSITIAEYTGIGDFENIPRVHFKFANFNIRDAVKCGPMLVDLKRDYPRTPGRSKEVLCDDTKILAQGESINEITHFLTADNKRKPLYNFLKGRNHLRIEFVDISENEDPEYYFTGQGALDLPSNPTEV